MITISESFQPNSTDFRTQLLKIAATKPDAIYMPGYPAEMPLILKQARELGIRIQFLSAQSFDDPNILKVAGSAAEGVIFPVPKPPDPKLEAVAHFRSEFEKMYGKAPGIIADTGYDAVKLIVAAMTSGGPTPEGIRSALARTRNFPGAAGYTTFDENGDVVKDFIFRTVRSGRFVDYKTAGK
jgi:branched-chain amino acid transport system substrate-binding protein